MPEVSPLDYTKLRAEPAVAPRASLLRDKLIPTIAITLVIALLGLLTHVIVAPGQRSPSSEPGVNSSGFLIPLKRRPASNFTLTTFTGETITLE